MDIYSFGIFQSESSNRSACLARPIVQYIDYAYWNRALSSQGYVDDSVKFWGMSLASTRTPFLDLPLDNPRPPEFSFKGETVQGRQSIAAILKTLHGSAASNGTLFDVILGLLSVLFGHLSEQSEVVFGIPYHGRDHPNLMQLCGYFINVQPQQTQLVRSDCI
jgi:hypothetical protein